MKNNPFTITFGKQPTRLIERYEDADRIISSFTAENAVSQTYLIEGIRGSGKTVLMTSVAKRLAEDKDWIVINLNPAMDLLTGFATRLSEAVRSKTDVVNRGFNISAGGFGIGVNGGEQLSDPVGITEKAFKTIIKKGKRVLITIDEVVNDDNMRIFASQFQIFVRQDYPIFLIMTGLYENINEIQNDPSLTFLLRSPKVITGPLSLLQIKRQYKEIFNIDDEKAGEYAAITKGYAFAFQALGVCLWDSSNLGAALEKFDEMLDDFVYKKIWTSLTPKERDIVLEIQEDKEKIGNICERVNMANGTFSKYKESLERKGVVGSAGYGYVTLSLPRFHEIVSNYIN